MIEIVELFMSAPMELQIILLFGIVVAIYEVVKKKDKY